MTNPADMPRLLFGVTCRYGPVQLADHSSFWGTRRDAQQTINTLAPRFPDITYTIITRKATEMDCPDCGRLLVITDHGPDCRHCGEEA